MDYSLAASRAEAAASPQACGDPASIVMEDPNADTGLHPRPATERSTPQTPLAEQHPVNVIPAADWDGQDGSGVPGVTLRHGLPPSPEPPGNALPNEAPQLSSGRQHAKSWIGSPAAAGGLQLVLPHCTVGVETIPPSPFNSLMGPIAESRARPESAVDAASAAASLTISGLLEPLLQAAVAADAAKMAANRAMLPLMSGYYWAAAMSVAPVVSR
jgi:hypothetical protein